MEKVILATLFALTVVFFAAFFSGTVLWACWDSIHAVFPTANTNLGLPKELAWWDAIKFSFVCASIFRGLGATTQSKSE
jgi:hypothetical protein